MIDYSEGIRFSCRRCGACCAIEGYVFINGDDVTRAAGFLHMTEDDFLREYTTLLEGMRVLKNNGLCCVFYESNRDCRINGAKPLQCLTWPFWAKNLESEQAWNEAKSLCPGIGTGRRYSAAEINQIIHNS